MRGTRTCGPGAGPGRRCSGVPRFRRSRPGSGSSRGGSRTGPRGRHGRRTGPGPGPRARIGVLSARARRRGQRHGQAPRASPVAAAQAASSCRTRSGEPERSIGPVPGPAPRSGALASRSAVSDRPTAVYRGQRVRERVFLPVHQVGDQAEHLRNLLALHVGEVLDDADGHGGAVAGQLPR